MDKKTFQISAHLQKVETMSDNSIKLVFETAKEITDPNDLALLFSMRNEQIGWLLFSPSEIKQEDIPEYDPAEYEEEKTPSQRLRSVLFLVHVNKGGNPDTFNDFYRQQMEKILEHYKEKIDN